MDLAKRPDDELRRKLTDRATLEKLLGSSLKYSAAPTILFFQDDDDIRRVEDKGSQRHESPSIHDILGITRVCPPAGQKLMMPRETYNPEWRIKSGTLGTTAWCSNAEYPIPGFLLPYVMFLHDHRSFNMIAIGPRIPNWSIGFERIPAPTETAESIPKTSI